MVVDILVTQGNGDDERADRRGRVDHLVGLVAMSVTLFWDVAVLVPISSTRKSPKGGAYAASFGIRLSASRKNR